MPSDSQSKPPTQKSTSERPPKRPLSEARAQGRKRTPVPAAWVESVKRSDAEHKSRSEARAQGRKRAPFPEGWAESDKPSNMETQSRSEARTQGKKRAPLPEAWSQNVKRLKSEHSTTSTGFPKKERPSQETGPAFSTREQTQPGSNTTAADGGIPMGHSNAPATPHKQLRRTARMSTGGRQPQRRFDYSG
ncbi:hypothetical protein HGRIS_011147 [Hohenbuehelia grisea]|uniref:Uncharacterized protein n=1 Tax=Hohenbuehelia grisea TaxID=104357 RepID=A0ABR3IZ47_9AGAR